MQKPFSKETSEWIEYVMKHHDAADESHKGKISSCFYCLSIEAYKREKGMAEK